MTNAYQFIDKLEELKDEGNLLFRGVTDANFPLVPKAFRGNEIAEYCKQFPHNRVEIQHWFSTAIKNFRTNSNKAFASIDNFSLLRICNLLSKGAKWHIFLFSMESQNQLYCLISKQTNLNTFKMFLSN